MTIQRGLRVALLHATGLASLFSGLLIVEVSANNIAHAEYWHLGGGPEGTGTLPYTGALSTSVDSLLPLISGGGPDGTGVLPFAGPPSLRSSAAPVFSNPTPGLVIAAVGQAVPVSGMMAPDANSGIVVSDACVRSSGGPDGAGSLPSEGSLDTPARVSQVLGTTVVYAGGGSEGTGSLPQAGAVVTPVERTAELAAPVDPEGAGILPVVGQTSRFVAPKPTHLGGGSDGAGSLPYVGAVSTPAESAQRLTTSTPGVVVDSQGHAVQGALVMAVHSELGIVALATTDAGGLFVLELPKLSGLELALPNLGLAGIPVTAGDALVVVAP